MSLYENGRVYVCTQEPYHDNSIPVGVTGTLQEAFVLHGHPGPEGWRVGDPVQITGPDKASSMSARRLWYRMGDPPYYDHDILQIVETPLFGPFIPHGSRPV